MITLGIQSKLAVLKTKLGMKFPGLGRIGRGERACNEFAQQTKEIVATPECFTRVPRVLAELLPEQATAFCENLSETGYKQALHILEGAVPKELKGLLAKENKTQHRLLDIVAKTGDQESLNRILAKLKETPDMLKETLTAKNSRDYIPIQYAGENDYNVVKMFLSVAPDDTTAYKMLASLMEPVRSETFMLIMDKIMGGKPKKIKLTPDLIELQKTIKAWTDPKERSPEATKYRRVVQERLSNYKKINHITTSGMWYRGF